MGKKLLMASLAALVGSGFTLVGKPYVERRIEERRVPILAKEIYRPDVSGFPEEMQREVTLLPVKYTLQHKVGRSAKNLTIFVSSDTSINASELRFAKRIEDYTCKQAGKNSVKVDIPTVRPGGIFTFDLLTKLTNRIEFHELIEEGRVLSIEAYEARDEKTNFLVILGLLLAILLWLCVIVVIILGGKRVRAYWRHMEIGPDTRTANIRGPLITLIIIIILYDLIQRSFGPLSGFLPFPNFSFQAYFYAFCLYLLITRYRLLEDILRKIGGKTTDKGNTVHEHINDEGNSKNPE